MICPECKKEMKETTMPIGPSKVSLFFMCTNKDCKFAGIERYEV